MATAIATPPVMATSRSCPMTASTSGTSSTLPVMVSDEPGIAMSAAASAAWMTSAIARRRFDFPAGRESIPGRC